MCKGSRIADKTAKAKKDTVYGIGTIGAHGTSTRIGALHAVGSTVAACVYCIQTGQKMTLENIPQSLQAKFGIGATAVVEFAELPDWHKDDQLVLKIGKTAPFAAFADQGVTAFVGVKEATRPAGHDTGKVVDALLDGANHAAATIPPGGISGDTYMAALAADHRRQRARVTVNA